MTEQVPFGPTTDDFASNPEQRTPCVLLLDVSGSMGEIVSNAGSDLGYTVQRDGQSYRAVSGGTTRIDELNGGLLTYKEELMADSLAAKRVEVAVVTFGGTVQTLCEFTTAENFFPPTLKADGDTPMGSAVGTAIEMVRQRKDVYKSNGVPYTRPWIFLITDGGPTDEWKSAAEKVKLGEASKSFLFFAVGVEGANFDVLQQLSGREPLKLKGLEFRRLFQWLSASQQSVSRSSPGEAVQLPSATGPSGWAEIPS